MLCYCHKSTRYLFLSKFLWSTNGLKENRWSINEDQFDLNPGTSNDNILSFHTVLNLPPLSLEHYLTVVCKRSLAPTDEFLKKKCSPILDKNNNENEYQKTKSFLVWLLLKSSVMHIQQQIEFYINQTIVPEYGLPRPVLSHSKRIQNCFFCNPTKIDKFYIKKKTLSHWNTLQLFRRNIEKETLKFSVSVKLIYQKVYLIV